MKGYMTAGILVLLGTSFETASGQFGKLGQLGQLGLNSKRETYTVPVSHLPEFVLANVKRIAISFGGYTSCAQGLKDRLSETVTRSGTFELFDPASLGMALAERDFQASAFADRANAIRLGKLLGPTAIVSGTVSRCNVDVSAVKSQQGRKDKKGHVPLVLHSRNDGARRTERSSHRCCHVQGRRFPKLQLQPGRTAQRHRSSPRSGRCQRASRASGSRSGAEHRAPLVWLEGVDQRHRSRRQGMRSQACCRSNSRR